VIRIVQIKIRPEIGREIIMTGKGEINLIKKNVVNVTEEVRVVTIQTATRVVHREFMTVPPMMNMMPAGA
jgi:hypothetical protein